MTNKPVEPLNDEELATARIELVLFRAIANNKNATVDIPTLLEGVGRLLATIGARDAELRLLRAVRVAASRHECDMWDMDGPLEAYETEHLGWPKWDGAE